MRHRIRHIHFIGIGGAGMCGLAQVMHSLGYQVSGSDIQEQHSLSLLRETGAQVHIGHHSENIADADCVVYSSAVSADNPERTAAAARGIPVIPRAQMLGEALRFKPGVAVTGTHGKTTVSSMLSSILIAAGKDPTCIIGGRLLGLENGGNARIGKGDCIVVEADESDASFLHLQPTAAIITNIDNDHLAAFDNCIENLRQAFYNFLGNLPFYGVAVICADDPMANQLAHEISFVKVARYGLSEGCDVRAVNARALGCGMTFTMQTKDGDYPLQLPIAGEHNVQNAVGACAMAMQWDVDIKAMREGLENFAGVARRLEHYGNISVKQGEALLIDDYAHHPTEITATLAALRGAYPQRRLLVVFQPHRYTRTRDVFEQLVKALSAADVLILLPVYAAGEKPLAGADSSALITALEAQSAEPLAKIIAADSLKSAIETVRRLAIKEDVIVTMGAGDIGSLPTLIKAEL